LRQGIFFDQMVSVPKLSWITVKKILVIEDEAIILFSTLNLLQKNGFDTVSAMDGYAGVELAKEFLPDLIVCNLILPKLKGDEVFRTLRNDQTTTKIPFIFLTAQSNQAEIDRLRQLGAEDYLAKPYTSEELLQAIAKILD
jgi:two-component system, OmpR family, alkaline phosphatase synthesis response regulator PhoP